MHTESNSGIGASLLHQGYHVARNLDVFVGHGEDEASGLQDKTFWISEGIFYF
jgi:hypothetical protein